MNFDYVYMCAASQIKKGYFVSKIVLNYCEKKIILVIKKDFLDWTPRIFKIFEKNVFEKFGIRNLQEKLENLIT